MRTTTTRSCPGFAGAPGASWHRRLVEAVPRGYFTEFGDDPEKRAYVIGIDWKKTVDRSNAKTYAGIFANPNIACKIYDEKTIEFLVREFGLGREDED